MKGMKLNLSGLDAGNVENFSPVENALSLLDGMGNHSVLLSNEKEYIHVLGHKERLGILLQRRDNKVPILFMMGLSKRNEAETHLEYGEKSLRIQYNELLALEDALLLCRCFFEGKAFPPAYNGRKLKVDN